MHDLKGLKWGGQSLCILNFGGPRIPWRAWQSTGTTFLPCLGGTDAAGLGKHTLSCTGVSSGTGERKEWLPDFVIQKMAAGDPHSSPDSPFWPQSSQTSVSECIAPAELYRPFLL